MDVQYLKLITNDVTGPRPPPRAPTRGHILRHGALRKRILAPIPDRPSVNNDPANTDPITHDECKRVLHDMGRERELKRLVILQTNMRGVGGSSGGHRLPEWSKLDSVFQGLKDGKCDIACLSETKIKATHIKALRNRYRKLCEQHPKIHYRLSIPAEGARRGSMIMWREDIPYSNPRVLAQDETNRSVVMEFYGSNGHKLRVASGYFENRSKPGWREQEGSFYRFHGSYVPNPNATNAHKHLYVMTGDLNVVLQPDKHRLPPRTHEEEDNECIRNHMREHHLVEAVAHAYPDEEIYTHIVDRKETAEADREEDAPEMTKHSKAKLSHILVNDAALAICTSAGWTERNPIFAGADHGLCYIALDITQHETPEPKEKRTGPKQINHAGAKETSCRNIPGFPVFLTTPLPQEDVASHEEYIACSLAADGYAKNHFVNCEHAYEHLVGALHQPAIRDAIKWNNTAKEYRIHCATESGATHLRSRGMGLPELQDSVPFTQESGFRNTDNNQWVIKSTAQNGKRMRTWLQNTLEIPAPALKKVDKGKRRLQGYFIITFQEQADCTYWRKFGEPLPIWGAHAAAAHQPQPSLPLTYIPNADFEYAAGRKSYTARMQRFMNDPTRLRRIDQNLQERLTLELDSGPDDPAANEITTDSMWTPLRDLMDICARLAFGEKEDIDYIRRESKSGMLFRHYTTLDRVIRTIKQKGWSFRHAYIKTLRKLPYSEARIRDRWYEITDTRHDWMDRAETLASRLMTSFRKRKEREMQQDKIALREQLDDHFAHTIGAYLDETIRPRHAPTYGASCPPDEDGTYPRTNHESRAIIQELYQTAHASSIPTGDEAQGKQWWRQLLQLGGKFSVEDGTAIDAEITLDEYTKALQMLGKGTAPGPTGIRYSQWRHATPRFSQMALRLMNHILAKGDLPKDFCRGNILPIPKDPAKPCTRDNARPLTMLETGLKILTKCISNRLNHAMARDPILAPTQFAFLPGMNIMDPIRIMEAVYEQARRNHKADATKEVHIAYLDLRAAFDKVEYWAGEAALNRVRVPPKIRALLHNLNTRSERSIITEHGLTDQWELKNGVPQGEILSPFRFLCLMDMLNTWLARRCAGNNPKREQIGFRFEVCKRPRYNQKWTEGNDTTRVHTLIYADDICLIAETAEHLQQLVGLVHEFFSTAGINLSDTKSYYTTNAPNPTPIYITGSMTQGADANLDGEWTPDTTGPSLTHKKPNESIRYLGVNFELNGTWETQKRIVEDTLKFCLERLEYKDMTMTQMRYVMNAVIIPKLKYALSISAIHQAPHATFCDSLDTTIRRFVLDYFRMARNTSTACVHSNLQHWGLGINSLKAKVYETIIHNTVSSLNDWDLSNKWDKKLRELRPEEHDTNQLYTIVYSIPGARKHLPPSPARSPGHPYA